MDGPAGSQLRRPGLRDILASPARRLPWHHSGPENPACHPRRPLRQVQAVEREVKRFESLIAEAVANDETTRSEAAIMESMSGVGKRTTELLAIELPELG